MIGVLKPGLLSTVQDKGRWGYRASGMPLSGALDRFSSAAAHILAGNSENAALLEMAYEGGTFIFERDTIVSLTGAPMGAKLNGTDLEPWSSFFVSSGSTLALGKAEKGLRSYMAVRGGLDVPVVMGSRSTYMRGCTGGLDGRPLRNADCLRISGEARGTGKVCALPPCLVSHFSHEVVVRAMTGPHDDLFTPDAVESLFSQTYTIGPDADRMGCRLNGPVLALREHVHILSEPMVPGAIQVPGSGLPIISMADCQTTGGYAVIATVLTADLSILAQAQPGDTLRFVRADDAEAVKALRDERSRISAIECYVEEYGSLPHLDDPWGYHVRVNGRRFMVTVSAMEQQAD